MSLANGTSDDDGVAQFDICSSTSTTFPILKICNNYLLEKSATVDDLSTTLDRIRRYKKSSLSTNCYSYYKRNMELNDTTTYEYCEIITKNCVRKNSERHRLTELKFLSKSLVQRSMILERLILYLVLIMKCKFIKTASSYLYAATIRKHYVLFEVLIYFLVCVFFVFLFAFNEY